MGEQVAAALNGGVAQLGEHLPCKQGVKSSNLSISRSNEKCEDLNTNGHRVYSSGHTDSKIHTANAVTK